MSEVQLAHFSWGETPSRSRIHDVAIRDARIATDHGAPAQAAAPRATLVGRLGAFARVRLAFAGGAAVSNDACGCPA
jgi:hypothetical protein